MPLENVSQLTTVKPYSLSSTTPGCSSRVFQEEVSRLRIVVADEEIKEEELFRFYFFGHKTNDGRLRQGVSLTTKTIHIRSMNFMNEYVCLISRLRNFTEFFVVVVVPEAASLEELRQVHCKEAECRKVILT
jgi:hypothetical protein